MSLCLFSCPPPKVFSKEGVFKLIAFYFVKCVMIDTAHHLSMEKLSKLLSCGSTWRWQRKNCLKRWLDVVQVHWVCSLGTFCFLNTKTHDCVLWLILYIQVFLSFEKAAVGFENSLKCNCLVLSIALSSTEVMESRYWSCSQLQFHSQLWWGSAVSQGGRLDHSQRHKSRCH